MFLSAYARLITAYLLFAAVVSDAFQAKRAVWQAGRVIGGTRITSATKYPFVVAIFVKTHFSACGFIVAKKAVVTGCHVLTSGRSVGPVGGLYRPGQVEVRAGITDIDNPEPTLQTRQASRLEAHPHCTFRQRPDVENDVGVIILAEELEFTPAVQPARFFSTEPTSAQQELVRLASLKTECTAMGFGLHGRGSNVKGDLEEVPVTVYSNRICKTKKNDYEGLHLVCVIGSTGAPCSGDSGSPLVCNGFVFGVQSAGSCKPNARADYANVEVILELANQYMNET